MKIPSREGTKGWVWAVDNSELKPHFSTNN